MGVFDKSAGLNLGKMEKPKSEGASFGIDEHLLAIKINL